MTAARTIPHAALLASEELGRASELSPLRVGIHDASRFEWSVVVPLPEHGERAYTIHVELQLPANAAQLSAPWEHLQSFTCLEGAVGAPPSGDATVDTLRRAAISLTELLRQARLGFQRHCRDAVRGTYATAHQNPYEFLSIWLEAALRITREARAKLVRGLASDSPLIARERALIDEFVSVRLLEMLAHGDHVLHELEASRARREHPAKPETVKAFAEVRAALNQALEEETTYRERRGFVRAEASSPASLERYVARAARLKKHFEEVLYLDRTTYLVDERVRQWTTILAAFVGGAFAAAMQVVFGASSSRHVSVGTGIVMLIILGGAAYAARDRIKELARAWITGRVYRYHAQRVSECRIPERRRAERDVVARAREWCNDTTRTAPDPLNPESGASLPTTIVEYVSKGAVYANEPLSVSGTRGVRNVFRYDLSPMFSRLHDETTRVPVVDGTDRVRIVDAPRRYYIPFRVRVRIDDDTWDEHATLVLDKRGLRRIDASPAESPYVASAAL